MYQTKIQNYHKGDFKYKTHLPLLTVTLSLRIESHEDFHSDGSIHV